MIYFTSDTHFLHRNILKYQYNSRNYSSIEEMDEAIIKKWNSTVNPKDIVYHLGDVFMGSKTRATGIINRLNGRINIILGNHDSPKFLKTFYNIESIEHYKIFKQDHKRIVLMHFPIEEWDRCQYGDIHLHGHCHGNLKNIKPNRFDIGWDVHQRLVPFEEVISWETEDKVPHHGFTATKK